MKKHVWIVCAVLAILLATAPAMAFKVISDVPDPVTNPDPEGFEYRICSVQINTWYYARIYYIDNDESESFTHGADPIRRIETIRINRSILNQDGPDLPMNRRL